MFFLTHGLSAKSVTKETAFWHRNAVEMIRTDAGTSQLHYASGFLKIRWQKKKFGSIWKIFLKIFETEKIRNFSIQKSMKIEKIGKIEKSKNRIFIDFCIGKFSIFSWENFRFFTEKKFDPKFQNRFSIKNFQLFSLIFF